MRLDGLPLAELEDGEVAFYLYLCSKPSRESGPSRRGIPATSRTPPLLGQERALAKLSELK